MRRRKLYYVQRKRSRLRLRRIIRELNKLRQDFPKLVFPFAIKTGQDPDIILNTSFAGPMEPTWTKMITYLATYAKGRA